jgi:hypothetical protein
METAKIARFSSKNSLDIKYKTTKARVETIKINILPLKTTSSPSFQGNPKNIGRRIDFIGSKIPSFPKEKRYFAIPI